MSYTPKTSWMVYFCIILPIFCCKPTLVKSAKNIELATSTAELKNWYCILDQYRNQHGHFPKTINDLDHYNLLDTTKIRYVFPKNNDLVEWVEMFPGGKKLRLQQDGRISFKEPPN